MARARATRRKATRAAASTARPPTSRRRARAITPPATALAIDHRAWIVENLLAGVGRRELADSLATAMPAARARREVEAIATAPLLPVCARLARRIQQLELVATLGRAHQRAAPRPSQVERRTTPSAEVFFRDYWAAHRPVVLTDATRGWPARRKWTPAWFRRTFGAHTIEVTSGREADPFYDLNYRDHRRRMSMGAFIDEVLASGTSNDLYMVSNNHTMKRAAFRPLLADVRPPPTLFTLPLRGSATSLWIGPAGTITPLHHDTTNILFAQIHGRKRVELVSPQETALLLEPLHGFYSPVDLDTLADEDHPALRALTVQTVELAPGDALYIPAGWWHRVTSLDVSISFSLLGFRRPNDFDWYRPGQLPRIG